MSILNLQVTIPNTEVYLVSSSNLNQKVIIFEDETHTSVAPATISRGLRAIFA
jgi:hypothetical protein